MSFADLFKKKDLKQSFKPGQLLTVDPLPKSSSNVKGALAARKDRFPGVRAMMEREGLTEDYEIVVPEPNQLQIDYDSPEIPERFNIAMAILVQAFGEEGIKYTVTESRSGNRHVIVDLPLGLSTPERIAWQAVFGSDLTREALGMASHQLGLANPVLLIEHKMRPPLIKDAPVCAAPKMSFDEIGEQ